MVTHNPNDTAIVTIVGKHSYSVSKVNVGFREKEFELTQEMQGKIKTFALQNPDEETCGFILNDDSVVSCPNVHYNQTLDDVDIDNLKSILETLQIRDIEVPDDTTDLTDIRRRLSRKTGMSISAQQRLAFEKRGIQATWHTHCLDSAPGTLTYEDDPDRGVTSDVTQAKLQRLPYVLWHTKFDEWDMYDPCSINLYPLKQTIERPSDPEQYTKTPYQPNRSDCLEVARVALWGMYEIDLGIYISSPHEYTMAGWQRYIDGFPKVGFSQVELYDTLRFKGGDCLLMQLPGHKTLHHLGVCVDEKNQRMLHVFDGRVSEIDHIAKWRRFVRVLFRHEKFL